MRTSGMQPRVSWRAGASAFSEQRIAGLYSRHLGQVATRADTAARGAHSGGDATCAAGRRDALEYAQARGASRRQPHDGGAGVAQARAASRIGSSATWPRTIRISSSKAADIIGLYLNPPAHAAVFCVDEKTAIQALDRKDPVLPLSPGRAERHGFEYYRHGTLSLYAAFNTKTGEVLGKTAERHTSAEFVAFLTDIVVNQPRGKEIHVIADNLSAHKTARSKSSSQLHPNVHLHFTPTYSSWLNQVELWFAKIERDVIARGVFTSVPDLKRKLMRYIRQYNKAPQTVKWKYADPSRHISTQSVVTGH